MRTILLMMMMCGSAWAFENEVPAINSDAREQNYQLLRQMRNMQFDNELAARRQELQQIQLQQQMQYQENMRELMRDNPRNEQYESDKRQLNGSMGLPY